jgi:hypothetical protein
VRYVAGVGGAVTGAFQAKHDRRPVGSSFHAGRRLQSRGPDIGRTPLGRWVAHMARCRRSLLPLDFDKSFRPHCLSPLLSDFASAADLNRPLRPKQVASLNLTRTSKPRRFTHVDAARDDPPARRLHAPARFDHSADVVAASRLLRCPNPSEL